MTRLSFRAATPALVCAGLVVGMITTTGSALPTREYGDAPTTSASSASQAIAAPISVITSTGEATLEAARQAVIDANAITAEVATSGLDVKADSTIVDTTDLRASIQDLRGLDVTPTLMIPGITESAQTEIDSVREATADLTAKLDAAKKAKAEAEAKAKAEAEAKAKAAAEARAKAEAEAKAKAEAEAAAASAAASSSSSSGSSSASVAVSPGSAKAIAKEMAASKYGWGDDQFACLVSLWNRESGWNVTAANSSGAYGIPQALPGSKMSSAGSDWKTSAKTQITWGLSYISGRYGTPCGAWSHSQSTGWY